MISRKPQKSKIYLFVVSNVNLDVNIEKIIIANFGTYALPKKIFYVKQLPKTRSGKILRRLLRNILADPNLNDYGDTSTILNLGCLDEIKKIILVEQDELKLFNLKMSILLSILPT